MPAQSVTIKKFKGLFVQGNSFGEAVPDGAFEVANNVVFSQDDICKRRRGLSLFSSFEFLNPIAITEFNSSTILATDAEVYKIDSSGAQTQFTDSFSLYRMTNNGSRPTFQTASGNIYFTSTNGVLKLESLSGGILSAGIPAALDVQVGLSGIVGILPTAKSVAYRVVFGRKDANNNNPLGSPSEYTVVDNASGSDQTPTLTFSLPSGLVAQEHYYQVYRTANVTTASEKTDENTLQLIYEKKLTSTDITNAYATFVDDVEDAFREGGAALYTNPDKDGIAFSNDQPPRCEDIALFKEMMFYANTETKYTLFLTLFATTSLSGNAIVFTFTSGSETYTGAAAENIGAKEFKVFTAGTPAQNITDTARSICKIINRQSAGKLYARYISSVDDLFGKIVVYGRNFSQSFSVTVSNSAISGHFQPEIPTSGTSVSASNDDLKNSVSVSKKGLPESVPTSQNYPVGSRTNAILRIIPLRDSLMVISEGGVFSIRGDDPANLVVTPVDTTAICKSKNSIAVLNNTVMMLGTQGVLGVTDTSVTILSRNIEPLMTSVVGISNLDMMTSSASYESERLYLLSTIEPNARLTTTTQSVVSYAVTSTLVTLTFGEAIDNVVSGDLITVSGFTGGLVPLNGTFLVHSISGATLQYVLRGQTPSSGSVSGIVVKFTGATVVYCYNTVTQAWSTWGQETCFKSAYVSSVDDKLYLVDKASEVLKERKDQLKTDYCERSYSATVLTVDADAKTATLSVSGYTPRVGDAIVVDLAINKIVSIEGSVYTFDSTPSFEVSDVVTLYAQYELNVVLSPLTLGDVSRAKNFLETAILFRTRSCTKIDVAFKTNLIEESVTTEWTTEVESDGWGTSPWGIFPWGLPGGVDSVYITEQNQHVRVYVPREAHRANYIQLKAKHSVATEVFDMQCVGFLVYAYGTKTTR